MNRGLIDELTEQLIKYRKDTGVSAARVVAMALELGFRHGVMKSAEVIAAVRPMDEEALPVPPAAV